MSKNRPKEQWSIWNKPIKKLETRPGYVSFDEESRKFVDIS